MTLWEKLKRRLSLQLWRLRRDREKVSPEVVWPPQKARPHTVVVFLPEKFEHFDVARQVLSEARRRIDPLLFVVCLRENYRGWIDSTLDMRPVVYTDAEKNWLGLPRTRIVRRLREYNPDMVIDLSPSYDPFLAHLSVMCGARLRLSFDYQNAGLFYNMLIVPEGDKPLSERYKTLISYL